MTMFIEFAENECINKRHPMSKVKTCPSPRGNCRKTVRDRMSQAQVNIIH